MRPAPAPRLQLSGWLNSLTAPRLDALRGRVVLLHAFQMLCPSCVSHGLPQAARAHEALAGEGLAVIGLHTVFEHHAAMSREALEAFVHEYRLRFPIGIDAPAPEGPVPLTMQAYGLRGTPSLVLVDRGGRIRLNHFGHLDDLVLGTLLGRLLEEPAPRSEPEPGPKTGDAPRVLDQAAATGGVPAATARPEPTCSDTGCVLPS
jgi:hypothetical protein